MPRIRLQTANDQRVHSALREEDSGNGACLDRVAQGGARAMRLQGPYLVCSQVRICSGRQQYPLLRLPIGRRQAGRPPILPHRNPTKPSACSPTPL